MEQQPQQKKSGEGLSVAVVALLISALALILSFGAAALIGKNNKSSASESGGAAAAQIAVTLKEFAIEPAMLTIPAEGAVLNITNAGTMAHNLNIPDLGVKTPDIAPGGNATVRVSGSKAGAFNMLCTIAGHEASGMKGTAHVGEGSGDAGATATTAATMTAEEMDKIMEAVAAKFPAETKGAGGNVLEPTIKADGTKSFELTAEIVDWEVEPGKIVKAWTYNGTVPGPTLKVEVGDKVEVILHNKLPESTAIHFHGVRVPNAMDGVPPYTQDPIKPGESFTYTFEAVEPAVGMYHSHHDAQVQVPNGLAGAFLIGDMPIPQKLQDKGYTKVDQEVQMVINDSGTIGLSMNGKSFPGTAPYKMKLGETMLVNYFNEGLMAHPMHLHQPHGWIIAKDGIPLDEPIPGDTINIAPGERYTVLYKAVDPGVWAWHCHILNHAEGSQGMFGMVTAVIIE